MNYKHLSICLSLCLSSFILANPSTSEEIKIYLPTAVKLQPLYLGQIEAKESPLSKEHLNALYKILAYDLNYNGTTSLLPSGEQKENLLSQKNGLNPSVWKSLGAAYVVKSAVHGKNLSVTVLSSQTGATQSFESLHLTGDLTQDRRSMHRLADSLHKALFGVEGVASTRILYAAKQAPKAGSTTRWVSEIWSCDWDGASPKQVTHEGNYCVTPVFLPTSSKFANDRFLYVSYKPGQPKIFIASLKEGSGKRLIDLKGHQMLPAISPQRDKIAFISDASGRTDLFVQPFNAEKGEGGKPVQLFSYPRATQASPTFSPDGRFIAFVSDKDGSPRIYTIPSYVQGARATPLLITRQNSENSCPSWSADGKKLAYSAKTKGVRQIWIYDFASKQETQLTDGPGNKENPSWAPDSKHLVFNSTDGDKSDLYVVNLNQPEAIKISRDTGIKHYPTWGSH